MEKELIKYNTHGHFSFTRNDSLKDKCNAPTDKIGVYIVYIKGGGKRELIYIGISGRISKTGEIICRKSGLGGIKDRLVNGHQFGKIPRKTSWSTQMGREDIKKIQINWYVTADDLCRDKPRDIERELLSLYLNKHKELPRWNKVK